MDTKTLESEYESICKIANEGLKIDFWPIDFYMYSSDSICSLVAYYFPVSYFHWSRGRDFYRYRTMYRYGRMTFLELFLNTDPCTAYLSENNTLVEQKQVMAHVVGHSWFAKNNYYHKIVNRRTNVSMKNASKRFREYEEKYGYKAVEDIIDSGHAIQEHINTTPYISTNYSEPLEKISEYDDIWQFKGKEKEEDREEIFPLEPDKNVLGFIANNSPYLEDWQRDVLLTLEIEYMYLFPNILTKIIDEGFSVWVEAKIMDRLNLSQGEMIAYNEKFARQMRSGLSINPYHVGYKILADIERRWNGDLTDEEIFEYNRDGRKIHKGEGFNKVLEVCEINNDSSLIRGYLTDKLIKELHLFSYKREENDGKAQYIVTATDCDEVRNKFILDRENGGFPYIYVENGDFKRKRSLYLKHMDDGRPLDFVSNDVNTYSDSKAALQSVQDLWGNETYLETVNSKGDKVIIKADEEGNLSVER